MNEAGLSGVIKCVTEYVENAANPPAKPYADHQRQAGVSIVSIDPVKEASGNWTVDCKVNIFLETEFTIYDEIPPVNMIYRLILRVTEDGRVIEISRNKEQPGSDD